MTADLPDPYLRERLERLRAAGRLRRAALRLTGAAPTPREVEALRRQDIGPAGRLAEDVTAAVTASQPVWDLIAAMDLPEDITVREYADLTRHLVGRRTAHPRDRGDVSASLSFADPANTGVVRRVVPGAGPNSVTAYRYATLTSPGGVVEPFVVALRVRDSGIHQVTATMPVAATFLRYEQEFGVVTQDDVEALEVVVRLDLLEVRRTHDLLLGA